MKATLSAACFIGIDDGMSQFAPRVVDPRSGQRPRFVEDYVSNLFIRKRCSRLCGVQLGCPFGHTLSPISPLLPFQPFFGIDVGFGFSALFSARHSEYAATAKSTAPTTAVAYMPL
jgi:hypothetical protein